MPAPTQPVVIRRPDDLYNHVMDLKSRGQTIGLVPTMGALHEGHLSLVDIMQDHADHIIVSIFVNPTQFGPGEDFGSYPRQEQADLTMLAKRQVNCAFIPTARDMYPDGFATTVKVKGLSEVLCGANRPGHFDGVGTVVSKLLLMSAADVAIFGEKDFQQLQIIRRVVKDLNIPARIIGAPIYRESDGLAASSRNAYLSENERKIASSLPKTMQQAITRAKAGEDLRSIETSEAKALLKAGFSSVDYFEFKEEHSLGQVNTLSNKAVRLFAAARIGKTRLIDNMAVQNTQNI